MNNRLGERRLNTYGTNMEIIKYVNSKEVVVQFLDEHKHIVTTHYRDFNRGLIKNPYDKNIYNVGFIGVGNYTKNGSENERMFYTQWLDMLRRCYDSKTNLSNPAYKGCTVCEEWHNFQNFAEWCSEHYYQIDNERMELDKDILFKNNKIYSPTTCCVVPKAINSLFVKHRSKRGDLPIGVYYRSDRNKYVANYSNGNKTIKIGQYNTKEEAFQAYKIHKELYIQATANKYKDSIPYKLYQALLCYEVEITD